MKSTAPIALNKVLSTYPAMIAMPNSEVRTSRVFESTNTVILKLNEDADNPLRVRIPIPVSNAATTPIPNRIAT